MICRRITLPELWRFLARKSGPLMSSNYAEVGGEVTAGNVWGVFAGSDLVAIGGVASAGLPAGSGVAWASFIDPLGPRAPVFVRFARRALAIEQKRYSERIYCFTAVTNVAGDRLAALLGFVPTNAVRLSLKEQHYHGPRNRKIGAAAV
jgi:hypothetical protein